jgi:uncharacterized protein YuzE
MEGDMKVTYDTKVDAAYIQFSAKKPDGGVELAEGIILHTTSNDEVVGLEILQASHKVPLKSLFTFELTPAKVA